MNKFEKEYKNENIKLIKTYLKHLQKMTKRHKLSLEEAIFIEHRLYYEVYLPMLNITKEKSKYNE